MEATAVYEVWSPVGRRCGRRAFMVEGCGIDRVLLARSLREARVMAWRFFRDGRISRRIRWTARALGIGGGS